MDDEREVGRVRWDGARQLIDTAIDTFGRLDVLVNNAGILRDRMLFNMTEGEWDAVMRVHRAMPVGVCRQVGEASVKGRDALHPSVEVVDEHLAGRLLTGDARGVLDRVVELVEPVEFLATSPRGPRAVFVLDDAKEIRHARNLVRRPPNR